jgi:hypothetical protein
MGNVNLVDKSYLKTVSWTKIYTKSIITPPNNKGFTPMALTKDHLIEAISKENGFQKKQSTKIVETLLNR